LDVRPATYPLPRPGPATAIVADPRHTHTGAADGPAPRHLPHGRL